MVIFTNSFRDFKGAGYGAMDVLARTMLVTAGVKMTTNGINSWMTGTGAGHADWN
jgi:hypothetical protein